MWAAMGTVGVLVLGALGLYHRFWLHHRKDWRWDEHEYPARPTGRPSPRAGVDESE